MTLIISDDGVRNTSDTKVTMGRANIQIGGNLINEGDMALHETDLAVAKDLIQKGNFTVNDPQLFAKSVLSLAKSVENVTAFGVAVLKLLSGKE